MPVHYASNPVDLDGVYAFAEKLRVLSGEMTKNEAIGYFSAIDIHCLGPVI